MTVDWDGQIRMTHPHRMRCRGLIGLKDRFQIAFAATPTTDRHGL